VKAAGVAAAAGEKRAASKGGPRAAFAPLSPPEAPKLKTRRGRERRRMTRPPISPPRRHRSLQHSRPRQKLARRRGPRRPFTGAAAAAAASSPSPYPSSTPPARAPTPPTPPRARGQPPPHLRRRHKQLRRGQRLPRPLSSSGSRRGGSRFAVGALHLSSQARTDARTREAAAASCRATPASSASRSASTSHPDAEPGALDRRRQREAEERRPPFRAPSSSGRALLTRGGFPAAAAAAPSPVHLTLCPRPPVRRPPSR
jgi:hypothetical protein